MHIFADSWKEFEKQYCCHYSHHHYRREEWSRCCSGSGNNCFYRCSAKKCRSYISQASIDSHVIDICFSACDVSCNFPKADICPNIKPCKGKSTKEYPAVFPESPFNISQMEFFV